MKTIIKSLLSNLLTPAPKSHRPKTNRQMPIAKSQQPKAKGQQPTADIGVLVNQFLTLYSD